MNSFFLPFHPSIQKHAWTLMLRVGRCSSKYRGGLCYPLSWLVKAEVIHRDSPAGGSETFTPTASSRCVIIVDAWQSSHMNIQYAGALGQGTVLQIRQTTENSLKQRHTSHTHCVVVVWLNHDGGACPVGWQTVSERGRRSEDCRPCSPII